jgi:hypothetical protein
MAEKVRIMAWKEEGIPSTATEGRLCRLCTSKKASSLRQGVFPLTQSLRDKKNGPATCQLSKDMETICVKKTWSYVLSSSRRNPSWAAAQSAR